MPAMLDRRLSIIMTGADNQAFIHVGAFPGLPPPPTRLSLPGRVVLE